MLEETPRDPAETRKRSPVPERWMWTAAGVGWGIGVGMLFGCIQGWYVYFQGDIQFYPEPANRDLHLISSFLGEVVRYAVYGLMMGTASGCAMSLVAGSLSTWPARFFVAAVLGAFVPAALLSLILLPVGGASGWMFGLFAMAYFGPIGCVAALLATASVWLMTVRAAKKREAAAEPRVHA